jgi:hypothetical protein
MTDGDAQANATSNYLFHRLCEAIGTIGTLTGEKAALEHRLAEALAKIPVGKSEKKFKVTK